VHGIHRAIEAGDARALARHVDFPALRESLRPQVQDRIVRAAGPGAQAGPFSSMGLAVASGLAGGLVDAMLTPSGLAAMLEGRKVWDRLGNVPPGPRNGARAQGGPAATEHLPRPRLRVESPSRASTTIVLDDGGELDLVLERRGTEWRLAGVRLPR
jgi:hypothetical protein